MITEPIVPGTGALMQAPQPRPVQRTYPIPKQSELHRQLMTKICSRIQYAKTANTRRDKIWTEAEERILAYLPESELDAKRRAARENKGEQDYTTIQIPYSYALLMSAHTYWTSVFFARNPVHQFQGLHGEGEMQVQALEALIGYQVDIGAMLGPYYIWLYDAGKYGLGVLGTYWEKEIIEVGSMAEMVDPMTGEVKLGFITQEIPGYEGNKVYNVCPFDFYHDPRVPVGRFQEGEFVFVRRRLSWSTLKRREALGYYMNLEYVKQAYSEAAIQGSAQLERPDSRGWLDSWDKDKAGAHPAFLDVFEFYVELIPSEWGLGSSTMPMKWVFTITENLSCILGGQPLGLLHGKFPFDVLETEVEAYGLYNRGIPEIINPIQNTMDWLINTHFYNVRASLNNQFILDPSKIIASDADGGPGFVFRLRPEAYGEDIDKFFKQIPVQDITRANMQDLNSMQGFGERILGINEQMMGALVGGRKTATEVRTSTGFGVNRMKTICEYMSATGFAPHALKLVQQSQQLYSADKKFRIMGDTAMFAPEAFIQVTPEQIAGNYGFVPVDGSLPVDRMAQANLWKDLLMNMARVPQVALQYDLGKIFSWVAQTAGLKNINQFRVQVLPPGAAPAPGMVPVPGNGPGPGADSSTQAGLRSLIPSPANMPGLSPV